MQLPWVKNKNDLRTNHPYVNSSGNDEKGTEAGRLRWMLLVAFHGNLNPEECGVVQEKEKFHQGAMAQPKPSRHGKSHRLIDG